MQITPYNKKDKTKKKQVEEMFDNISKKYDFLNHFFSMGIDILWRKRLVKELIEKKPENVLDIATGTGDLAIEIAEKGVSEVKGIDISEGMLNIGRNKIAKKNVENIELIKGDSENLPFKENIFDAIVVAFGVRNFDNIEKGLKEMNRVLKKGGGIYILEFSLPETFPLKQIFGFYFKKIMPFFGKLISKDGSAYEYLPNSVHYFPSGKDFMEIMKRTGFEKNNRSTLTGG
ncbi:MAG: bifunctional demethylmenaquinone methyltransferase/2-methoxy-6-polyprenyl-1,4-benzoquinol methylase UbiE, partial [Flavobacteriales bacterium]